MTTLNENGIRRRHRSWGPVAGFFAVIAGSSALALGAPTAGMGVLLLSAAAIAALRTKVSWRGPALMGAVAALGLYFSTGVGSVDLPALVPLSMAFLLFDLFDDLNHQVRDPRLPVSLLTALSLFGLGLLLGIIRGPNGREGLRTVAILGWLLCLSRLAVSWAGQGRLTAALRAYSLVAAAFGLVNVVFFIFPSWEEAYFRSWISQVFVEPDSVRRLLTGDELNNALSPYKAATLYINANVAAMFFGTAAWAAYGYWRNSLWRPWLIGGCMLGAIGTVSRGGALGAIVSLAIWGALQVHRGAVLRVAVRLTVLTFVIGAITIGIAELQSGGLARFAWTTLSTDPRFLLWGAALNLGMLHPVLGSGFGAWESYWPSIATSVNLRPSFPPHNVYLFLWIIGGLAATLGFLFIGVSSLRRTWSLVTSVPASDAYEFLATGAILAWCWSQANFENLFFLDYRLGFLLCMLLGGLFARREAILTA